MPSFSAKSLALLKDCHPDLIKIAQLAIQRIDFSIIEGHRTKERQKELVKKGASQTMNSKHCEYPARAFDFLPYPFNGWNDLAAFNKVGEVLIQCAKELGIDARRGADWNMNGITTDEKFYDGPHFELMSEQELARYGRKPLSKQQNDTKK